MSRAALLLRNFFTVTLRLLIVTLVMLELASQVVWRGEDACADLFGQAICLLPRPILSTQQLDILTRLDQDQATYMQFDPILGWSIRPDQSLEHGGATYTSNDIGIRALRPYALEPAAGVTRIAAFGPSFTHGDEVSDRATWAFMLEQAWPDLEVMNWGVSGYGTDQAFLRYQTQGAAYAPHIVLVGLEPENIYRNLNRFRPFYQSRTEYPLTKPVFALEGEGLALLPNPFRSPAELRDAVLTDPNHFLDTLCPTDYHCLKPGYRQSFLDRLKSVRLLRTLAFGLQYPRHDETRGTSLVGSYTGPRSPPAETTLRILRAFDEAVQRNGGQLVVVVFPASIGAAGQADEQASPFQALIGDLRAEGIPVLDLTPAFVDAMHERGVEFDAFISPAGGHYNVDGNRVVSQAVLDGLIEMRMYAP